MASSITSAGSFATANMKPVPDEQIDALWGQNIADNTGFLYGRALPHPYENFSATCSNVNSGGITLVLATTIYDKGFFRIPGHNTVVATVTLQANHYGSNPAMTYDNSGTMRWGFFGDLGTVRGTSAYSAPNTAGYSNIETMGSTFSLDSVLSVGSWGAFQVEAMGTTTDPDSAAAYKGYMTWDIRNIKVISKWV